MRISASLAVLLMTAAGGCATFRDVTGQNDYVVNSATPTSITIRFEEGELAQAEGRANGHCSQYGRAAVMQSVAPDDGDQVAVFSCI